MLLRCAASHGHYHAENGHLADNLFCHNLFRQAVLQKGQLLFFRRVNAHFQNGVAERRIRELQDHARCMLIHANRRWPEAITPSLWLYPSTSKLQVLAPILSTSRWPRQGCRIWKEVPKVD